jgi:hypothetical protein
MELTGLTNDELVELVNDARAELRGRGLDVHGEILGVQKEYPIRETSDEA